jgi:hypothetical protein
MSREELEPIVMILRRRIQARRARDVDAYMRTFSRDWTLTDPSSGVQTWNQTYADMKVRFAQVRKVDAMSIIIRNAVDRGEYAEILAETFLKATESAHTERTLYLTSWQHSNGQWKDVGDELITDRARADLDPDATRRRIITIHELTTDGG